MLSAVDPLAGQAWRMTLTSEPGARTESRPRRPVILAVDDEPAVLAAVARDMRRGFGERYRIMRAASGTEALELLGQIRARGE